MLQVQNLTKEYPTPRGPLAVLADVSFSLAPGEAAAIMGPSGAARARCSICWARSSRRPPARSPSTAPIRSAVRSRLAAFGNETIGFVFQDHCLLPQCTVLENVLIPTLVATADRQDGKKTMERARELVRQVGLGDRIDHRPGELPAASGSASRSHAR